MYELTEAQILFAMHQAKTNSEACELLGISPTMWKQASKRYTIGEGGETVYNYLKRKSKNLALRVPTKINKRSDEPWNSGYVYRLEDILRGAVPSYPHKMLKRRLLSTAFLPIRCVRCHWEGDPNLNVFNWPIMIWYRNNNIFDKRLENIDWLCYNCFFTQKHWNPDYKYYSRKYAWRYVTDDDKIVPVNDQFIFNFSQEDVDDIPETELNELIDDSITIDNYKGLTGDDLRDQL